MPRAQKKIKKKKAVETDPETSLVATTLVPLHLIVARDVVDGEGGCSVVQNAIELTNSISSEKKLIIAANAQGKQAFLNHLTKNIDKIQKEPSMQIQNGYSNDPKKQFF